MDEHNSLSQSEIFSEGTSSDVSCRGVGADYEACSVRKDSIVYISVLQGGSCVVPFAVNDEPKAQQDRYDEEGLERGDGGHRMTSDTRGDCFTEWWECLNITSRMLGNPRQYVL